MPVWHRVGVGGGGAMFVPTISPHDPSTVILGCDMTGCYITHDAGVSWRMFNLRGKAQDICFDPHEADTVYIAAGNAGLWCSRDSGTSWDVLCPHAREIQHVAYRDDHADTEYLLAGGRVSGSMTAVATDPANPGRLFAARCHARASDLLLSTDAGASWQSLAEIPGERVVGVHVDPYADTVYVVTESALFIWADGLRRVASTPGDDRTGHALGFAPDTSYFYWATTSGLFVSRDYGRTWSASALGESGCAVHAIGLCECDPRVAYLSFDGLAIGGRQCFGIGRTVDGGADWSIVCAESEGQLDRIDDDWVNRTPARSEWAWGIGVGPQDPELCYTTDWGSAWRTTTGGTSWKQVYFRRVSEGSVTTTGLDVTTNYGIFFDPFDTQRQFICYTDIGLIRSEDGGRSWMPTQDGIPRRWHNTTYWMVFDPDVRGRVWAVMSGTHDLPRPKMWRNQPTSRYDGGVCRSDDGGRTWHVSTAGLPPLAPTHILLDPNSTAGERTLYLAAMGHGVFVSHDDGRSWQLANDGIQEPEPLAWRLSYDGTGGLYLVVFRRGERDGDGGSAGALYHSASGSERWQRVTLPPDVDGPAGILVDPDDPIRLYLAAWRRGNDALRAGGGIYRSTDSGRTWENVLDRDQHIYDVTVRPGQPGTLFASGFESNAWISRDRGTTWSRINGFNFKWGHRVIADPLDPASVYVATFGGGLWHGPIDGDDDPGDIATPELRYADTGCASRV